jgi:hypothetical protein
VSHDWKICVSFICPVIIVDQDYFQQLVKLVLSVEQNLFFFPLTRLIHVVKFLWTVSSFLLPPKKKKDNWLQ